MVLDIDKVCRLCLEISSNSIFSSGKTSGILNALNDELISKIFECTSLKVATGDGLPESVCESCIRQVENFVIFRKMCWDVDSKLRKHFFDSKIEDGPVEILPSVEPELIEVSLDVKSSWIKGESISSADEGDNGNHDCNEDSEDDCISTGSKSRRCKTKMHACDLCNDLFSRLSDLKNHREEEHLERKRIKPLLPARKEKQVLTCNHCNKSFKQLKRYKDHMRAHEEPPSEKEDERKSCDSNFQDDRTVPDLRSKIEDESHAGESTKSDSSGGKKRKVRKVYDCEYCGQVFQSYAKYTLHELTHTGEKKYSCSDCARSFTHKHSLIGHIKEQHTGEVNFTCDVCGRGFVHQSTFTIHKKTHSTERPLKCPDCDKCFTQMKNLRVHRQIHSASRSHTCQVCGKSFNFMKTLKVHLVLHSGEKPYVCNFCGKAFAQSAPLKTHTRIHTGEKPYECTICPSRFSTNNALKSHVLKHSGEAPFCCTVCSKGFSRKKDMVAHQEETHSVFIGLPGQTSTLPISPQNTMQDNSMPSQQSCVPQPLQSIPGPLLSPPPASAPPPPPSLPHQQHMVPHQSTPHQMPHSAPMQNHNTPQLHHMNHHPSSPHLPPPNCMPQLPHYNPPHSSAQV